MYTIVVYDIGDKKVNKIHKYLKKRLTWIQNSVFEGELSESEFIIMKNELKKMIKGFGKNNSQFSHSVIIFHMPYVGVMERIVIGDEKNPIDNFI